MKYFILSLKQEEVGWYIKGIEDGEIAICMDMSMAWYSEDIYEVHQFAHRCGYQDGEYAIYGYFI